MFFFYWYRGISQKCQGNNFLALRIRLPVDSKWKKIACYVGIEGEIEYFFTSIQREKYNNRFLKKTNVNKKKQMCISHDKILQKLQLMHFALLKTHPKITIVLGRNYQDTALILLKTNRNVATVSEQWKWNILICTVFIKKKKKQRQYITFIVGHFFLFYSPNQQ